MASKKYEDSDWQEGYLNNVWCRFKTFLSSKGNLFVVAKRDSTVRVFMLTKKVIEENKDQDFNDIMAKAEEIPSSKIPRLIRKVL
ncbi:MAG: hypothetical protein HY295_04065 [Thaumarchaeota archaeon]|nr:hypothetical protein [Nitrososphaerota archaeon]